MGLWLLSALAFAAPTDIDFLCDGGEQAPAGGRATGETIDGTCVVFRATDVDGMSCINANTSGAPSDCSTWEDAQKSCLLDQGTNVYSWTVPSVEVYGALRAYDDSITANIKTCNDSVYTTKCAEDTAAATSPWLYWTTSFADDPLIDNEWSPQVIAYNDPVTASSGLLADPGEPVSARCSRRTPARVGLPIALGTCGASPCALSDVVNLSLHGFHDTTTSQGWVQNTADPHNGWDFHLPVPATGASSSIDLIAVSDGWVKQGGIYVGCADPSSDACETSTTEAPSLVSIQFSLVAPPAYSFFEGTDLSIPADNTEFNLGETSDLNLGLGGTWTWNYTAEICAGGSCVVDVDASGTPQADDWRTVLEAHINSISSPSLKSLVEGWACTNGDCTCVSDFDCEPCYETGSPLDCPIPFEVARGDALMTLTQSADLGAHLHFGLEEFPWNQRVHHYREVLSQSAAASPTCDEWLVPFTSEEVDPSTMRTLEDECFNDPQWLDSDEWAYPDFVPRDRCPWNFMDEDAKAEIAELVDIAYPTLCAGSSDTSVLGTYCADVLPCNISTLVR